MYIYIYITIFKYVIWCKCISFSDSVDVIVFFLPYRFTMDWSLDMFFATGDALVINGSWVFYNLKCLVSLMCCTAFRGRAKLCAERRGGSRPQPNCRLRKIFFAQWQVWMEYIAILMSCPTFALKASPTRWERTSMGSKPAPKGKWRFWRLWKWNKLRRCRSVYLQRRDGLQNAQPYRIS